MKETQHPLNVISPLLPDLEEFIPYLKDIWDRRWLTNMGHYHNCLEEALADYLGVKYLSLFTNGTIPLITALQAMHITGEVITTPYSFVATTHALWWNGITPVFVDVDPETGNMDPDRIEAAITPRTAALLPVHVYGHPCDTEAIASIAAKYGLRVLYDAAHAFGVRERGKTVLAHGDFSTLSFHATKVYNTIEGGALVCHDAATKQRIDHLKNFGFAGETSVVSPGINGKMDEVRAAFGLLQLQHVDEAIARRRAFSERYRAQLAEVEGIRMPKLRSDVVYNYAYFPIYVDATDYGMTRDALYEALQEKGVMGRRYFYPLISSFSAYRGLPSADPANLPVANRLADTVICLPMHQDLSNDEIDYIVKLIKTRCCL